MYYETAAEQGASIFRSISGGHMFMNGNKRTAVAAFQSFAGQHGLKTVSQQQINDERSHTSSDRKSNRCFTDCKNVNQIKNEIDKRNNRKAKSFS